MSVKSRVDQVTVRSRSLQCSFPILVLRSEWEVNMTRQSRNQISSSTYPLTLPFVYSCSCNNFIFSFHECTQRWRRMRVDGYTPRQEMHSAFAETRERPKSRHPVPFEQLPTSTNAKECHRVIRNCSTSQCRCLSV